MSDPSDIRHSSVSSAAPKKTVSLSYNSHTVIKVLVVIVLIILGFIAGAAYGRSHPGKPETTISTSGNGFSQRVKGGGFGTVSAVSSTSITVENDRDGTSKTFNITSSTKITDNGQSVSPSAISSGDRVIVVPSSSNSSDAATILVNPGFGGGFGGSGNNSQGSSTSGSSTSGSSTSD